jgi:PAS domain S-box-containing protein
MKAGKKNTAGKEALPGSEMFRTLFEKMPDAVIIIDRKGTLIEGNEMAEKLSGYRKSEMLGRNLLCSSIMDTRNKKLALEKLALHFSGKEVPPFSIEIHKKDGNIVPVEVNAKIIDYSGNKVEIVVLRAAAGRKNAEQTTNETLEYAESIVETVREPLIVLDAGLRVVSANKSFYLTFKVNPKETQGRLIYDLGNRQWNIPRLRKLLEEILPNSARFDNYEVEHDFPNIGRRIMLLNARHIPGPPEKPRIILLAIEDITGRKRLEKETLQAKEEEFRAIFDNAAEGILLADPQSKKFIIGNNAICRMLGYSIDEIKTLGVTDIHPEKDIHYVMSQFKRQAKGEFTLSRDLPLERKDGSVFYADVNAITININKKKYFVGFFHDTTERKKNEEDLRKKIEELERFKNMVIGRELKMVDLKKRINEFERRTERPK